MYLVVSKWQIIPGKEAEAEERGRKVRAEIRGIPGIDFVQSFRNEAGELVAILGYASQGEYERIVKDPNGPFERALAAHGLEGVATWVSSDRGESIDD